MPHSPTVTVQYNSSGWSSKLSDAISDGNYLKIVLKGSLASEIKFKVESFPVVCQVPAPPLPFLPIPFPKIAMSSWLAGLPTLLGHVLVAFTSGYSKIGVRFSYHGAGQSDNELVFSLK